MVIFISVRIKLILPIASLITRGCRGVNWATVAGIPGAGDLRAITSFLMNSNILSPSNPSEAVIHSPSQLHHNDNQHIFTLVRTWTRVIHISTLGTHAVAHTQNIVMHLRIPKFHINETFLLNIVQGVNFFLLFPFFFGCCLFWWYNMWNSYGSSIRDDKHSNNKPCFLLTQGLERNRNWD